MKLFYGWVVVAAGFIITCVGLGTAMSLGVFQEPITTSMGWSRTDVSSAAVLTFLAMGGGSFLWGVISDRFGTRTVLLSGGTLLGVGLMAASQVTKVWQFQLLWGICGGLAAGAFFAPLTAIASRWFIRHRSLAVALITAGMGLGSMVIGPTARAIMSVSDWRTAMFDLGLIALAVVLPVSLLVRNAPVVPASASGVASDDKGFTVAQALRTPQFAAVAGTFFACCAAHSGPIFHMVSNAIDCGVPAMTAATVLGTAGVSSLFGRIIFGLTADRLGAKPTLVAGLLLQATSIQLYYFTNSPEAFYAVALVFGLSYGGVMPLYAILVRECFGARIMGSMFGAVAMVSTIGMAIGPWAGGYIFDHTGSYGWLYIGSCAIGLGAAAICFAFRPPAPVARLQMA